MSVLVPSLTNNHHHHHHSPYFSTATSTSTPSRRLHGSLSHSSATNKSNHVSSKATDNDQNSDHVPFGMVNSMKQRFLNKVNESFLLNNTLTIPRHSLSKPSSRLPSNENLLQTKTVASPLKSTTRLSRSQDNLTNDNNNNNNNNNNNHNNYHHTQSIASIVAQAITAEQFTSYLQPKQDLIIVDTTSSTNDITANQENIDDGKLRLGQKALIHRQSYTELHVDEAPKPGRSTSRSVLPATEHRPFEQMPSCLILSSCTHTRMHATVEPLPFVYHHILIHRSNVMMKRYIFAFDESSTLCSQLVC